MAMQTGLFPFTGRVGNVIGYKRNGVHFVRSMPSEVNQTASTRKAAKNFGIASSKGSLIRRAFTNHLDVKGDSSRVNRLNQTLIQSDIQGLQGYQFNRHTGVKEFFSIAPELSTDNILRIPAQKLPVPGKAASLEVKLITTKIDFNTRRITNTVSKNVLINLSQPFEGLEMDASLQGKGTLLIALQVRVLNSDRPNKYTPAVIPAEWLTNDRRYKAADIIAIVPPIAKQAVKKQQKRLPQHRAALSGVKLSAKKSNVTPKNSSVSLKKSIVCPIARVPASDFYSVASVDTVGPTKKICEGFENRVNDLLSPSPTREEVSFLVSPQ